MKQKEWERRLTHLADKCIKDDKYAMMHLYLTLSNNAANWINAGLYDIEQGDTFTIPHENGNCLQFKFYNDTCELQMIDSETNNALMLISAQDSAIKEYSKLRNIEESYKFIKQGLGLRFPISMTKTFENLKPGDSVTFPEHNTYCCVNRSGNTLTLSKLYGGSVNDITYDTVSKIENIKLNIYNFNQMQDLFVQNRSSAIIRTYAKVIEKNHAQEFINKLILEVPEGKTRQLQWGQLNILVRKKRLNPKKGFVWYIDGHKVDEDAIKVLYAYFNSNPTQYDFIRKDNSKVTDFNDWECVNYIQHLSSHRQYEDIYQHLCDYVKNNDDLLTIDIKTFKPDVDGNFISQKFSFSYENGIPKVYGITFVNNDFKDEIETIKEISMSEFKEFCVLVNSKNYDLILDAEIEKVKEEFDKTELNWIYEQIAKNRAVATYKDTPLISQNNIKSDATLEDIIRGFTSVQEGDYSNEQQKHKTIHSTER